jgi:RNA polymerase sigma factor (sigma-70 family)
MSTVPPSRIIRHLRGAALRQAGGGPDDANLLERFLAERDEAAFEALVRRHGPMVFGVCRRLLGRHHDAEDAFQATFLVLACKAATVRDRATVGSWLFAVAYRTANRARARAARRFVKEQEAAVTEAYNDKHNGDDLARLLDLELSRLPEEYRGPILLCDLQGAPRKEAARQLGVPVGTLASRLATGRSMLAKRLTRRGLALASGGVAALIVGNVASASVPAPLIGSTVQSAARVAAGQAVTAAASVSVASLAKGVMNTMLMSKLKIPLGLVLALGLMTLGWGAYHGTRAANDPPAAKELAKAPAPEASTKGDSADDDIDLPSGVKPLLTLHGRNSKIKEPKLLRITTADEWQSLWMEHKTGSAKPKEVPDDLECTELDFDKVMAIAVFEGDGHNCRGYSSHSIAQTEGRILVRLEAHTYQSLGDSPGTQAWGILILPRSNKEVVLQHDVRNLIADAPKWEEWTRFSALPEMKR